LTLNNHCFDYNCSQITNFLVSTPSISKKKQIPFPFSTLGEGARRADEVKRGAGGEFF
jgi:hypothetical protein